MLTVTFVVVEAITAFVTGSLALLSDAAHMLTDGVAIALALGSIVVANRASHDGSRTFGLFRLEILASLVNALLTFAVAGYVLVEAALRLVDGDTASKPGPMLVVAVAGLAVNLSCSSCCAPARRTAWRCAAPTSTRWPTPRGRSG